MSGHGSFYVYDHGWAHERERLAALAALFDDVTARRLDAVGVRPGWRCWEAGAGAGTVARRLAELAGPDGHVLATDVDLRFLAPAGVDGQAPVEVLEHDVADGPVDRGAFDLVHARAVLEHVPEREEVVARLVRALRPGGVLLLECVVVGGSVSDALAPVTRPRELATVMARGLEAIAGAFRSVGADPEFGLRLPSVLAGAGLADVRGDLAHRFVHGGTEEAAFLELSLLGLGGHLVEGGLLSAEDLETVHALTQDPAASWMSIGLFGAWGHRP